MRGAPETLLALEGVRHGYGRGAGRVVVLDGVELTIGPGERVGLAGPSGTGKSTLARIAALVEAPNAGQIRVGDQLIQGAGLAVPADLRRRVQMLWQAPRPAVDPRHRLDRIITESLRLHGEAPADRRARLQQAVELAAEVGLTADLLPRRTTEVSDGQLQRACVARALSLQPDVLIADEPGAMLDVSTQAALLEIIDTRVEQGMGVLLIAHDTTLLTHWCDRILWLRNGQLRDEP